MNLKKGFTLVELMIVIATIALLMLILTPRMGITKNKVREIGIRTNMLMLEGVITAMINDYAATDVNTFEDSLEATIDAVTDVNQQIRNPITGNLGCDEWSISSSAVTYASGDNDANGAGIDAVWTSPFANSAGCIVYCAYTDTTVTPNKLTIKLLPYGPDNSRISELEKTISQF